MAWKFLLVFVTVSVFRIVDARSRSTCTPDHFGIGIDIRDCIAAEDEIYKSLEPDQDYTVTRTFSLYDPDRRKRVPQAKTLRTCGIGFDIADPDQQMITTTVLKLRLNIQALMGDCVSQGGHSGFRLADGLVFVLSNPLVVNGYGTCLAAQIPNQPKSPQRLNLLQCMNKHGSDPTFFHGMKAIPDHPSLTQPDYGVQGRAETRKIRRAALPVSPASNNHNPERYTRPPRPPIDRGRGGNGNRGESPNRGGQSPRARLDQAPPQPNYARSRTPLGIAYREQSPGSEGSVFYGHAGRGGSRESSPGIDHAQFPPLAPTHGSASIPNIPQGGYLPGFHPQYHHFQAHDPAHAPSNVHLHSIPGFPSSVMISAGPIAQGLQDIPGVPNSRSPHGNHPGGHQAGLQDPPGAPYSGPSHGNHPGVHQAGSQPGPEATQQGGALPTPALQALPVVSHWRPSYAGAVQNIAQNEAPPTPAQGISAPPGRGIRGDLPQGALWVPYPAADAGNVT